MLGDWATPTAHFCHFKKQLLSGQWHTMVVSSLMRLRQEDGEFEATLSQKTKQNVKSKLCFLLTYMQNWENRKMQTIPFRSMIFCLYFLLKSFCFAYICFTIFKYSYLFCVWRGHISQHTCGGQRMTCGSQFSPSTVWVPGDTQVINQVAAESSFWSSTLSFRKTNYVVHMACV